MLLASLEIVRQLIERAAGMPLIVVEDRALAIVAARRQPVRVRVVIRALRLEMHLPRDEYNVASDFSPCAG